MVWPKFKAGSVHFRIPGGNELNVAPYDILSFEFLLILYCMPGPIWATQSVGKGPDRLIVQSQSLLLNSASSLVFVHCICHYVMECNWLQVVFRGGEGALQCLPPLIDVIPEARLNLVIYYLKQGKAADIGSTLWT